MGDCANFATINLLKCLHIVQLAGALSRPLGTPDRRGWSPTKEGSAFFDRKSEAQ